SGHRAVGLAVAGRGVGAPHGRRSYRLCWLSMPEFAPSERLFAVAIPGSELPGPYGVGEYAAALRKRLRAFARVQIVGELVNLRFARARVYFELRDAQGAIPCAAWREEWDAML